MKTINELYEELDAAEKAIRGQHEQAKRWAKDPRVYNNPTFAWSQVLKTARVWRMACDVQREIIELLVGHIVGEGEGE